MCVCTRFQGQMYFQQKTCVLQFGRVLTQNSWIRPIMCYLWMIRLVMRLFFLWGQPLKIIHKYSAKKRSSPLDFIFGTCASASSSHFYGWWSWTCVVVPFCKDKFMFSKHHMFCNLGARWHKKSWIRPIMSYLWMTGLVMRLFSWGQPLKIIRKYSAKKKVQPLGFYFWHLRLGLFKSLFWLVKLNMCGCTLLQGQIHVQQTPYVL